MAGFFLFRSSMNRRPLKSYFLTLAMLVIDGAALWGIWLFSHGLRKWADPYFANPINTWHPYYSQALVPYVVLWAAVLGLHGHYSHHRRISSLNEMSRVVQASFTMFLAMPALAWFLKEFSLGRSVVLLAWALLTVYLYASRTVLRVAKRWLVRHNYNLIRVLIFGTGDTARQVAESIKDHPEVGYHLVGFVDDGTLAENERAELDGFPVLGARKDIARIARETRAAEVFLARPDLEKDDLLNLVVELEDARVDVKTVANVMKVITGEFCDGEIADFPVMNLRDGHLSPQQAVVKRVLDLAVVLGTAPIWGALWAVIAIYLKFTQGGPVHFTHERVGKDGRVFRLIKFRTMTADTDPQSTAPKDATDPRITRAGRWLRKTSLDELPQLINVLVGDMSLVGPRPEMPFIVAGYEEWQRRRLDVLPGITGLWQVIGRKNLPLHYNLEYDFYYIRNQSLWLDVTILLRTIPAVVTGHGAF